MSKLISILLVALVLVLTNSCTKELPFPEISASEKLVINSVLSPNAPINVHVSESCHINDTNCSQVFIADAKVKLTNVENGASVNLQHQEKGIYTTEEFALTPNSNYKIEVEHGSLKAESISKIPKAFTANFIEKREGIYGNGAAWIFDIEINDDPDEENYYLIEAVVDIVGGEHENGVDTESGIGFNGEDEGVGVHIEHFSADPNAENQFLTEGVDYREHPFKFVFLTDKAFNGQKYKTHLAVRDYDFYRAELDEFLVDIHIRSVTKEMYNYFKSLEQRRIFELSPFSEPIIISGNIDNGIGIFGTYSEQVLKVELGQSGFIAADTVIIQNNNCIAPCTVSFSTNGGALLSYNWDFGDGEFSTEPNPEHLFTEPGEYDVDLSYTLSHGDFYNHLNTVTIR